MKNASVIQGSFYASSDYAMKGCILKGKNFFFGIGGMVAEMTKSELAGSNFMFGAMQHRLQQQSNSTIPSQHSEILLITSSAFPLSPPQPHLDFLGYRQVKHLSRPLWLLQLQPGVEHVPRAAFFSAVAFLCVAFASGFS